MVFLQLSTNKPTNQKKKSSTLEPWVSTPGWLCSNLDVETQEEELASKTQSNPDNY